MQPHRSQEDAARRSERSTTLPTRPPALPPRPPERSSSASSHVSTASSWSVSMREKLQQWPAAQIQRARESVKNTTEATKVALNIGGEKYESWRNGPDYLETYEYVDEVADSSEDKIRLLEVLPGKCDDHIFCRIRTVSLSDHPVYEALSYYWGVDVPCHSIAIVPDGAEEEGRELTKLPADFGMVITSNLRSALRHVRLEDRSRVIWADAVCINQAHTNERNHQVALMHQVYSNAERTLVWLGEEENGSDLAFTELRRMLDDDRRGQQQRGSEGDTGPKLHASSMFALATIVSRDWFSRLWPVQEVLLAKEVKVLCSWQTMPWADFQRSMQILSDTELAPGRKMTLADMGTFDNVLSLSGPIADTQESSSDPFQRLTDFLLLMRPRNASNPLDKVFGLLGLVTYSDGKPIMRADYRKTALEVYEAATRLAIENTNSLDIMGASGSTTLPDGDGGPAASWIGDYRSDRRPLRAFRHLQDSAMRPVRKELHAQPGDISLSTQHMRLKGCFVGELKQVSAIFSNVEIRPLEEGLNRMLMRIDEIEQESGDKSQVWRDKEDGNKYMNRMRARMAAYKGAYDIIVETGSTMSKLFGAYVREAYKWELGIIQALLDWETFAGLSVPSPSDDENRRRAKSPATFGESLDWNAIAVMRKSARRDEYWHTLAGGNLLPAIACDDEENGSIDATRVAFERFYDMLSASRKFRQNHGKHSTQAPDEDHQEDLFKSMRMITTQVRGQKGTRSDFPRLLGHAQGRRLAMTTIGHLVLVAEDAKPGDKLAFCKGAKVPFLLRSLSEEKTWRFVGEAYSHALRDWPLHNAEWEDILIA